MAQTPGEDGSQQPDPEETSKLELPSLSLPRLGRRRGRQQAATPEDRVTEPAPLEVEPQAVEYVEPVEPVEAPRSVTQPEPEPTAPIEPVEPVEPVEPEADEAAPHEPVEPVEPVEPSRARRRWFARSTPPIEQAEVTPAAPHDETPTEVYRPADVGEPTGEPSARANGAEPPGSSAGTDLASPPEPEPVPLTEPAAVATPAVEDPIHDDEPDDESDEPGRSGLPPLPGRAAAAVTGLLMGAAGAMATYVALRGCDALRGAETCGGTGLLILVVILIAMVLVGGVLLALWDVTDPRSTSFLAVGLLCVIVLLTLMQQLFSPWMFLVVPVLSALCYLASHWVTTTFIEPTPEKGPEHDVR